MATVNYSILGLNSAYASTVYLTPTTTAATVWSALNPPAGYITRTTSILATNITASTALLTVAFNTANNGTGTSYRFMFQVPLPPHASIVVSEKSTPLYIDSNSSIVVTVGTANAIQLSATYEQFSNASANYLVKLAGNQSTSSITTLGQQRTNSITGNSSTTSVGTATPGFQISAVASLTSIAGLTGNVNITKAITGLTSTGSVFNVLVPIQLNSGPTATGSVGTMIPGFVVLSANSITTSPGSVTYQQQTVRTTQGLFGYGFAAAAVQSMTNKMSNTGVISADTTGVGTARYRLSGSTYGTDKGIFGYGANGSNVDQGMVNLVSNTGVVASDSAGGGTARTFPYAGAYGFSGQAVFAFGYPIATTIAISTYNLVTNTGTVGGDTTSVATAKYGGSSCPIGGGQLMCVFGRLSGSTEATSSTIISNTGVPASDVTFTATTKSYCAGASIGGNFAISAFGQSAGTNTAISNVINNVGVVGNDVTGVGTARYSLACAPYGTTKAKFGYGVTTGTTYQNISNDVTASGTVASDAAGVGTARYNLAGLGFSTV